MKHAYFGYRKWSYDILTNLSNNFNDLDIDVYTVKQTEFPKLFYTNNNIDKNISVINPKELSKMDLSMYDSLLFYGWSWMVPKDIVNNYNCICLHPSPLPKYRGGSPIQHQIINGEDESAVTLFKMGEGLDDGPIYMQKSFSLEGNLNDIFKKITETGTDLTSKLLLNIESGKLTSTPQDNSKATYYSRRKPEDSTIKYSDLNKMTSRQLHDFIRALQPPYPQANILDEQGKKIYLHGSSLDNN